MPSDRRQETQCLRCVVRPDLGSIQAGGSTAATGVGGDDLPTQGDRQRPSEQCMRPSNTPSGQVPQLLVVERGYLIRAQLVDPDLAQRRRDIEPNLLAVSVEG
jgi:hypothetical protein